MRPGKTWMTILLLGAGLSAILAGPVLSEVTGWESRSSMPYARYMGSAVAAGAVFYTGGLDGLDAPQATMLRHDPSWDTWLVMSPMPTVRYDHAAVSLTGAVYVIGGRDASGALGNVEVYDPLGDAWTSVAALTTPRYGHGATVAGDLIYVFGGRDAGGTWLAAGESYDPATDTWTDLSTSQMDDARAFFPLAFFPAADTGEDELFALAGETASGPIRDTESLPPGATTWFARSNLSLPRSHFTAAELYHSITTERELYAIGGLAAGAPSDRVDFRSASSEYWNASGTSLLQSRYAHGSCVLGDVIHVLGGYNGGVLNSHEGSVPNSDPTIYRAVASMNTSSDGSGFSMKGVAEGGFFAVHILLQYSMIPEIATWEGRIDCSSNLSITIEPMEPIDDWTGETPGSVRMFFANPRDASEMVLLMTLSCWKTADGPAFIHLSAHDTSSCDPAAPCYGDGSGSMLPMDGAHGIHGQPLFLVIPDEFGAVGDDTPRLVRVEQSYPNPFNPSTTIVYALSQPLPVTLEIYDISGRLIRVLLNSVEETAGRHEIDWYGLDEMGRRVASGTYFYRLQAGDYAETKRMTLVK